ncbi:MAG: AbrB/MazE/SpoVT family DNA-binding domain-containing protein [Lachnospiraceae bacterium]|nr:AbrB/MazE/SpoVT family DNA-binding domain-containing protein [Lachnospiraceae bacterium]
MNLTGNVTLSSWGNSQGIRIPKEILKKLHIKPNDELTMKVDGNRLIVEKTVCRRTLEEYAKPFGGKLGPYEEFDFGEGIGIDKWLDDAD